MNQKKAGTIILYADDTGQTQVRFCLCHSKWVAIRSQLKKGLIPMKRTVPVIPLSSNAGVMRPQCVLSPSQPSECEEV